MHDRVQVALSVTPARPPVERVRGNVPAAFATRGVVGVLGGLIGLGRAEFRPPRLVGFFRYGVRPAGRLNLLMSLVTVTVAAATRPSGAGSAPSGCRAH